MCVVKGMRKRKEGCILSPSGVQFHFVFISTSTWNQISWFWVRSLEQLLGWGARWHWGRRRCELWNPGDQGSVLAATLLTRWTLATSPLWSVASYSVKWAPWCPPQWEVMECLIQKSTGSMRAVLGPIMGSSDSQCLQRGLAMAPTCSEIIKGPGGSFPWSLRVTEAVSIRNEAGEGSYLTSGKVLFETQCLLILEANNTKKQTDNVLVSGYSNF